MICVEHLRAEFASFKSIAIVALHGPRKHVNEAHRGHESPAQERAPADFAGLIRQKKHQQKWQAVRGISEAHKQNRIEMKKRPESDGRESPASATTEQKPGCDDLEEDHAVGDKGDPRVGKKRHALETRGKIAADDPGVIELHCRREQIGQQENAAEKKFFPSYEEKNQDFGQMEIFELDRDLIRKHVNINNFKEGRRNQQRMSQRPSPAPSENGRGDQEGGKQSEKGHLRIRRPGLEKVKLPAFGKIHGTKVLSLLY